MSKKRKRKKTKPAFSRGCHNHLSASALQTELWSTLQAVKNKRLKPLEANAVATQSREICRISKLQLEIAKFTGKQKMPGSNLLIGG